MAVLYRKYRPQTFAQVLNQKFITQTLKNQIATNKLAHAYLFTGSRGVGKTSIARILAKAMNCKNVSQLTSGSVDKLVDACGVCDVCKQIEANNFIDLVEIDAASNTGVDNIRDLIEHVKFAPSIGKYKVFIIDEVHMLSKGAFNALLKTLEEPPKHAVFILATTEISKVPSTIISRTQRFDFKALSESDLKEHLAKVCAEENINLSEEILDLVAQASEGSVRDSLSLLGKVLSLGSGITLAEAQSLLGVTDVAVCINLLELIAHGQTEKIPDFFFELSQNGTDYKILTKDFLEFLRKVLIYKTANTLEGFSAERQESIKQSVAGMSLNDTIFIIRLFLRSFKELESSPAAEIPLMLASIEAALKKTTKEHPSPLVNVNPSHVAKKEPEKPLPTQSPEPHREVATVAVVETVSNVVLEIDEIKNLWPKAIAKIKTINGPLSSMLRTAQVLEPEQGRIVLGVKFLFDKQNIENAKNLGLINQVLKEVFQKEVGLRAEVVKEEKNIFSGPTEALSQALQVFGGELVE